MFGFLNFLKRGDTVNSLTTALCFLEELENKDVQEIPSILSQKIPDIHQIILQANRKNDIISLNRIQKKIVAFKEKLTPLQSPLLARSPAALNHEISTLASSLIGSISQLEVDLADMMVLHGELRNVRVYYSFFQTCERRNPNRLKDFLNKFVPHPDPDKVDQFDVKHFHTAFPILQALLQDGAVGLKQLSSEELTNLETGLEEIKYRSDDLQFVCDVNLLQIECMKCALRNPVEHLNHPMNQAFSLDSEKLNFLEAVKHVNRIQEIIPSLSIYKDAKLLPVLPVIVDSVSRGQLDNAAINKNIVSSQIKNNNLIIDGFLSKNDPVNLVEALKRIPEYQLSFFMPKIAKNLETLVTDEKGFKDIVEFLGQYKVEQGHFNELFYALGKNPSDQYKKFKWNEFNERLAIKIEFGHGEITLEQYERRFTNLFIFTLDQRHKKNLILIKEELKNEEKANLLFEQVKAKLQDPHTKQFNEKFRKKLDLFSQKIALTEFDQLQQELMDIKDELLLYFHRLDIIPYNDQEAWLLIEDVFKFNNSKEVSIAIHSSFTGKRIPDRYKKLFFEADTDPHGKISFKKDENGEYLINHHALKAFNLFTKKFSQASSDIQKTELIETLFEEIKVFLGTAEEEEVSAEDMPYVFEFMLCLTKDVDFFKATVMRDARSDLFPTYISYIADSLAFLLGSINLTPIGTLMEILRDPPEDFDNCLRELAGVCHFPDAENDISGVPLWSFPEFRNAIWSFFLAHDLTSNEDKRDLAIKFIDTCREALKSQLIVIKNYFESWVTFEREMRRGALLDYRNALEDEAASASTIEEIEAAFENYSPLSDPKTSFDKIFASSFSDEVQKISQDDEKAALLDRIYEQKFAEHMQSKRETLVENLDKYKKLDELCNLGTQYLNINYNNVRDALIAQLTSLREDLKENPHLIATFDKKALEAVAERIEEMEAEGGSPHAHMAELEKLLKGLNLPELLEMFAKRHNDRLLTPAAVIRQMDEMINLNLQAGYSELNSLIEGLQKEEGSRESLEALFKNSLFLSIYNQALVEEDQQQTERCLELVQEIKRTVSKEFLKSLDLSPKEVEQKEEIFKEKLESILNGQNVKKNMKRLIFDLKIINPSIIELFNDSKFKQFSVKFINRFIESHESEQLAMLGTFSQTIANNFKEIRLGAYESDKQYLLLAVILTANNPKFITAFKDIDLEDLKNKFEFIQYQALCSYHSTGFMTVAHIFKENLAD